MISTSRRSRHVARTFRGGQEWLSARALGFRRTRRLAEPAQPRVLRLLSKLIGGTLLASAGSRVGVIHDFIVKLAEGGYPKVTGMEVRAGDRSVFVSMRDLKQVGVSEFQLKTQNLSGGPFERRAGEVLLKRDILGACICSSRRCPPTR